MTMKTETEQREAVKWNLADYDECVIEAQTMTASRRMLAECVQAKDARQIVREHNAFPALVGIIKELQSRHFVATGNDELYNKATAALALAEKEEA